MAKTKREQTAVVPGIDESLVTPDLVIEVDLTQFELDDWEKLDPRIEGISIKDVIDVLDRLVVGGVRNRGFKGMDLMTIQKAVGEALQKATNPVANGKN